MKSFLQIALLISYLPAFGAHGASFRNLDFESPVLPLTPGGFVPVTNALPGWRVFGGETELTEAVYNSYALSLGGVALFTFGGVGTPPPIEGSFTAYLYSGLVPRVGGFPIPGPVSMVQSGMIPLESRSLQFLGNAYLPQVSLGGTALSVVPLSIGSDYIMYGADITPFAGQELELRFTAPLDMDRIFPYRTDSFLDSIQFSTTPVPEPSTYALLAISGIVGWFCWWRKRR